MDKVHVIVDSNEVMHGYAWTFPCGVRTTTKSLIKNGCDYSVRGLIGTIGVERKSFSDYVRCIGAGYTNLTKQIDKLRTNKYHCIIVEGDLLDPIPVYSRMNHAAVAAQTANIVAKGVPVIFAGTRNRAALMCYQFMVASVKLIRLGHK